MRKFELVLLIHAHQPVGNFDDVIERAYKTSYLPFIEVLARHPGIRAGLHYSGPLLEWIERSHPEYFDVLRALVRAGQIEIVSGGFYEPVLISIPHQDRREQIARLTRYIEKHFGVRPRGAWLTERVWEPEIPSSLAPASIDYTLVDDNHFLGAGFELDQLYGYALAEDLGHTVKVIPGLKVLRYLIPFREVSETRDFLQDAASKHPGAFAAMGDDLEKFGVWPGTYEHCYTNGWLERFFLMLEQSADWLTIPTPSDAVSSRPPFGRAELPTASYTEMMEWSLPTPARNRYHDLVEEFSTRPDALPFLRGGTWRGFFSKYAESNLLHKKMLHVSKQVRELTPSRRRDQTFLASREEATTLLMRGQCNDPYWHGIFGGLYSPHLRTAVWRSLAEAEALADLLTHRKHQYVAFTQLDFDADGRDEIYFTSDRYAALLKPDDGATLSALDFRPANVTLINSLMRRPESYHAKIRNLTTAEPQAVHTIHDQVRTKEEGLERWLNYDRWPRHAFRVLLFAQNKTQQDYAALHLEEDCRVAAGRYRVADVSETRALLASEDSTDWPVDKTLSFAPIEDGFEITCDLAVRRSAPGAASVNIGIEVVLNFLAPNAPDRYFESNGRRFPLRWSAAIPGQELRIVDEWQAAAVSLVAPNALQFWIAPIETVSESEDGFERIYQGSQVLSVWPVELAPDAEWRTQLKLTATRL
ncbi:MAG TPA: alpha-amylase/4-alpha-glucanotransferase domain-containing protein [Candidatus Baltobacteraceae bacterium]|nr:alpha-amylase/4-alpha-glucanotransferase domain-containing protein [Candidatus Baltobacteraceae bacterium]